MTEDSPHYRAQQAAYRVWKLPHFRLSVFQHLLVLHKVNSPYARGRHRFLQQFLLLDRESFREVAMLLYPVINLDQFPWDCPSEVSLSSSAPRLTRTG